MSAKAKETLWLEVNEVVTLARESVLQEGPPVRFTSVLYAWDPHEEKFAAHMTVFENDEKTTTAAEIQKQALTLFPQAILLGFTGWHLDDVNLTDEERALVFQQSLSKHPKARYALVFMLESIWGDYANVMKLTWKNKDPYKVKSIAKSKWNPNTRSEGRFTGLLKPLEELN